MRKFKIWRKKYLKHFFKSIIILITIAVVLYAVLDILTWS